MSDDQNRDDEQARREYIRATFGNDALEGLATDLLAGPGAEAVTRAGPGPGPDAGRS